MAEKNLLIPASIVIAGLIIAASVLYVGGFGAGRGAKTSPTGSALTRSGETAAAGSAADLTDDDPSLGDPSSPVTMIEFSDFQCPFCRSFWQSALPEIQERYIKSGKVRFIYRDFPISAIHDMAETYAQAGECADEQGKFWPMHDKIFDEQNRRGAGTISGITASDVKRWARETGLDAGAFEQCLDSGKYAREVAKDLADGQAAGVSVTPTVFINGRSVIGALPFSQFKVIIEEALAQP